MDSNAFLNDLMSKMKLPEAKGKKKAEQSESVAQILAAMQKVKTEKKKPPVTSYAPTKEMPVNELESMEEFSQLASDVMQECRPAIPAVKTSISEKTVRVAAYIRVSSTNPAQEDSYEMQERYFMSLLAGNAGWTSAGIYSDHGISATSREGRTGFNRLLRHCKQGKIDRVICKSISRFARNTQDFLVALRTLKENNVTILFEREAMDTADAYSEFILTTLAAIAQEESRSISANIAWSNQKRFPAGNVCNLRLRIPQRGVPGERERIPIPGGVHHPGRSRDCSDGVPAFYKRRAGLHTDRPEAGCPAYPAAEQRMQTAAKAEADCAASWRTKRRR